MHVFDTPVPHPVSVARSTPDSGDAGSSHGMIPRDPGDRRSFVIVLSANSTETATALLEKISRLFAYLVRKNQLQTHSPGVGMFIRPGLMTVFRAEGRDDRLGVIDAPAPGARRRRPAGRPRAGCRRAGRDRATGRDAASRSARTRGASSGPDSPPSFADQSTVPSSRTRSTTMRIMSPSRTLPIGPPASASGPTWPMQAPVETPENRASVMTATCLPKRGAAGPR